VYESASGTDNAEQALASRVVGLLRTGRGGLVTDIDGTISPIVARPEDARVLPVAREALRRLRDRLAVVAVVSGRSAADARAMVDLDGLVYIGNHGFEVWAGDHTEVLGRARAWVPRIAATLDEVTRQLDPALGDGVLFENKGPTASVHYRLAPDPDGARRRLLDLLAAPALAHGVRLVEGRRVINLVPRLGMSKGSAVRWLVREHALHTLVYLGDDVTDTHAFRALRRLRRSNRVQGLAVGVVGPETPASVRRLADASLPSASAVAQLLCRVLDGLIHSGIE
jgi:trehalose 6-phosphate phosphatase